MSDPKEILDRRLDQVAEEHEAFALHFFCQLGGNDDVNGLTTLQIAASGATLLSWRRGEDNKLYSVQLSQSGHVKFYAMLRKFPFWDASPSRRPGLETETHIHLRLADQAAGTHGTLQFWDMDIDEFPTLHHLLQAVMKLIRRIGGDEVPHLKVPRLAV